MLQIKRSDKRVTSLSRHKGLLKSRISSFPYRMLPPASCNKSQTLVGSNPSQSAEWSSVPDSWCWVSPSWPMRWVWGQPWKETSQEPHFSSQVTELPLPAAVPPGSFACVCGEEPVLTQHNLLLFPLVLPHLSWKTSHSSFLITETKQQQSPPGTPMLDLHSFILQVINALMTSTPNASWFWKSQLSGPSSNCAPTRLQLYFLSKSLVSSLLNMTLLQAVVQNITNMEE